MNSNLNEFFPENSVFKPLKMYLFIKEIKVRELLRNNKDVKRKLEMENFKYSY